MNRSTNSVVHWSSRLYLVRLPVINTPAKYKCIVLCTSVPRYTPMESES